jgi:hypothetical protein
VSLRSGDGQSPVIEAVVYPRPDYEARLWSQWGQGVVLSDGRFLSAMGDHLGADGNSFLFIYDPTTRRMTRFTDVFSNVPHDKGAWGYGKIHAQMVTGRCGEVFLSTYWGTREGLQYSRTYDGDLLFRFDPATLELQSLGSPAPKHGVPTLAGFAPRRLVYGGAVDPRPHPEREYELGEFFAYDAGADKVAFRVDDERLVGFRSILVDGKGTAYLAGEHGQLLTYRPGSDKLEAFPERLPGGGFLRASTPPSPDGTVYGVTQDPNTFFALHPDGSIADLGQARGYTTSLALAPDGSRFFYAPGAFGDAAKQGTPLVAVDTKTGKQTVVVELRDLIERQFGLIAGGSYNVVIDPSGDRVYVGLNAGHDEEDPWGEVVLAVVHLR